jgi:hypothetical protein
MVAPCTEMIGNVVRHAGAIQSNQQAAVLLKVNQYLIVEGFQGRGGFVSNPKDVYLRLSP